MKEFDINRFVIVFKRIFNNIKAGILGCIAGITGCFLLISIALMFVVGSEYSNTNESPSNSKLQKVYQIDDTTPEGARVIEVSKRELYGKTMGYIYEFALVSSFIISVKLPFSNKQTKADRINDIMLPASTLEKFLSRIALLWLMPIIVCVPAIALNEIGRMLISQFSDISVFEQFKGNVVFEAIKNIDEPNNNLVYSSHWAFVQISLNTIMNIIIVLSFQAVSILVCCYSRKYVEIKAVCVTITFIICSFYFMYKVDEFFNNENGIVEITCFSTIFLIITVVCWVLAYHYSKMSMVIENRFLG